MPALSAELRTHGAHCLPRYAAVRGKLRLVQAAGQDSGVAGIGDSMSMVVLAPLTR